MALTDGSVRMKMHLHKWRKAAGRGEEVDTKYNLGFIPKGTRKWSGEISQESGRLSLALLKAYGKSGYYKQLEKQCNVPVSK